MRLYHGSDVAVRSPQIAFNKGFADLGYGFYLTDDSDVARARACSRARRTGQPAGVVSVFEFDQDAVPWVTWGEQEPSFPSGAPTGAFGLRFEANPAAVAAWAAYIMACRKGQTQVPGLGNPVVVRAWIATEEVAMVCSGYADPQDLKDYVNPADLVVQYCLLDQDLIDQHLVFMEEQVAG